MACSKECQDCCTQSIGFATLAPSPEDEAPRFTQCHRLIDGAEDLHVLIEDLDDEFYVEVNQGRDTVHLSLSRSQARELADILNGHRSR